MYVSYIPIYIHIENPPANLPVWGLLTLAPIMFYIPLVAKLHSSKLHSAELHTAEIHAAEVNAAELMPT